MKKNLLILALLFTFQLHAADYYWVGGAGNWSDLNHWRLGSSGGSIPSIVPSSSDNVFFDAGSGFTAGNNTVTVDANSFCNNMTWGAVSNNPRLVGSSAAFTIQVSGSVSLSTAATYNIFLRFQGATPATLVTNGTVSGEFGFEIDKPGSSLTLSDNLVVPANTSAIATNAVYLTSGTFDVSGKTVNIYQFLSENNNVRTFEMTNTSMLARSAYRFVGLNKTVNATGSTLATYTFVNDGGSYNKVTASNANGPNTIIINNSAFKSLTFLQSSNVFADIGFGNIVDTLVFTREGSIGTNNTVGSVSFGLAGSIDGTGNTIRKITALSSFQVSNNYINTVDSVILAPNRTATFRGTFNINKYLYVAGASCDAYTEIYGDSTLGTVNFAAGAVVDISNVILTGVKATGPVTPIAVNGIDGTGNAGFTITEPTGTGTTLYWVGGAGDWNDKNHWSFTSGGAGGACVPFKYDNVVFDANSGLATRTVTTSSSAFCKDITWTAGVGATTFLESTGASFRVYGSVTLQPTIALAATFEFYGTDPVTLTTNGGATGSVQFYIAKTGSGSVTLTDNWINNSAASSINFVAGGLNLSGRTVTCRIFVSNNNNTRNLDISNATITTNLRWIYLGANKTLVSTGSHITSHATFQIGAPNSTYPSIDLSEINRETSNDFSITSSTIGQLTFTSTSTTGLGRILYGNTIRRLEYKGAGIIGSIGNNNIDSLILAGSRNYVLAGSNTIYKYFKAEAATCGGLTEIRGSGIATLAFQPAAEIHIANVYMQNVTATGVMTPIAFNGANAGGNTGWTINAAPGSPRYWVGGSGNWNDANHWSATSGGAPGACVPTVNDDVFFDAGSGFTAASKTVSVNSGNAYCRNIDWTGAANAPILSKSATWNMEIWGDSIILNPTATITGSMYAKGSNPAFLKGNTLGDFDLFIDKPGSSLTLLNDYINNLYNLGVVNGALNASGLTLSIQGLDNTFSGSGNPFAIDISNSRITTGAWRFVGTIALHSLNATNSSITANEFQANGMQYDTVNVTGTTVGHTSINSATINRLTFTDPSTTSAVGINGSNNTIGRVEYKGSGTITGTGNAMDTLIFFPGNTYTLSAGTNNTVNDAWYGSGTPCRATEIVSSSTTTNATLTKNGDPVIFDYIRLRRITAAGSAAPFEAQKHSTNLGNNINWNIAPYDGAAPIYGLGPDTAVLAGDFPIVLHTSGFFGSPSSQYTWNDNSTADTLLVNGPGTYSVAVSFPDGCTVNDQIIVTLRSTLPVTLVSFTGKRIDCQSQLNWKVADAVNFSRFEIEKSNDGYNYSKVAEVIYTGSAVYTWTDPAGDIPTVYYRLKMVDENGEYSHSNIISVRSCHEQPVKVYPTITAGSVQVSLPGGYEHATIHVYNSSGQRMNPLINGAGSTRTVHLQHFAKGAYIVQVINGMESKSFTIIKQ